jgi:hypothetical protein
MPDPSVLEGARTDYLYSGSSNFSAPNMLVRSFRNLEHLGPSREVMPQLPPWSSGFTGSPDVRHADGLYVMWFASPDNQHALPTGFPAKCIGLAVASSPLGPFVARSAPIICGPWGTIDPRTFVAADGHLWLYYKSDDNAAWGPTQNPNTPTSPTTSLWAQRLAPDDMTLEGPPHELLAATLPWEHKLIEAPDMVEHGHRYFLFFSANPSYQDSDSIAVAVCNGPAGPCREPHNGPLLGSDVLGVGPGEESLFTQDGATWLLYSPTGTGFYRQLAVARIAFDRQGPYVSEFGGRVPGPADQQ